jgi:hypothetical protein
MSSTPLRSDPMRERPADGWRDRDRRVAGGVREELRECAPGFRKDVAHSVHEPVDLGCGRKKDSAQHETEAARRMRLRVGERKRRSPRAAEYEPAVDVQMDAQPLEIVDQRLRRVAFDLGDRCRAAGTALVEQHDAPERGVEIAAMMRQAAASRAAVQEHDRNTVGATAGFPVERVQRIDGKPSRHLRVDFRKQDRVAG